MARLPVRWPKFVVDFFQPVEIEEQNREAAARAARALNFGFEHFEQAPVIGEPGERIGSSEPAHLIEKLRVVEQRAAQHNHITHHHQNVRQRERSVENMLRLAHGDVAEDVQRRCEKERAIERCIRRDRRRQAYPTVAAR